MTTPWVDDPDLESAEYESESEGLFGDSDVDSNFESDFDTEDLDAESRASQARRRRARARRVALARRRQATARARGLARQPARQPTGVPPAQRATAATARAVRTLDLETKVQEDTFRNAIAAQNKRMSRGEYAAVAGAAVNQFIESFDAPDNPYARAALRFSPLLLLAPQRKGRGVEGLIKDPRVIGGAAVAALVFAGENRSKLNKAREIRILQPPDVAKNATHQMIADVLDGRGANLPNEKITWEATGAATINADTGVVTAGAAAGLAVITARSGDLRNHANLKVV